MNLQLPPGGLLIGLGSDLIDIERIRGVLDRQGERFLERVFTDEERAYCLGMKHPHKHFAARFAAKEAVMKALGVGWGQGAGWLDIEVVRDPDGPPRLELTGRALGTARVRGVRRWCLSLSHAAGTAIAFVVAED